MMPSRKAQVSQRWRHVRSYSNTKVSNQRRAPLYWSLKNSMRTYSDRFMVWLQNRQCQHYGPKAHMPELFQRRDLPFLALQNGKLRMKALPPACHHNLLDAAARVGALEVRLGYTFKNRMTCIEALKVTGTWSPLYFDGMVYNVDKNNRLALLGDRVLSLAICELWFQTEHSTKEYSDMSSDTVSRASLAVVGRALGLRESILSATGAATRNHVAETFEAVLGAIYVDSNYSMQTVKDVIKTVKLDDHRILKTREQDEDAVTEELAPQVASDHQDNNHVHNDLLHRREPAVRDVSKRSIRIAKRRTIRSEALEQAPVVNMGYYAKQDAVLSNDEKQSQAPPIAQTGSTHGKETKTFIDDSRPPSTSDSSKTHTDPQTLHAKGGTITPEAQLEVESLQRLSRDRVERSKAATEALHRHAMLMRKGVNVSPLRVFREIRAEIGKAYDLKLKAVERRNRAEGMAPHVAKQKAHEEVKAEKDARVAEEQARNEAAAPEQTYEKEKEAEKTNGEPTKSTTAISSSKGSSGIRNQPHTKMTRSPAFLDTSYVPTTEKDKASEAEGNRKTFWSPPAQSPTTRTTSFEEPPNGVTRKHHASNDKVEELIPHITATRPTTHERDGGAKTSKRDLQQWEQYILKPYTHAWSFPKSEAHSVSQTTEERTPSYVPKTESRKFQGTKPTDDIVRDGGADLTVYESEMDLLMGGFMNYENDEVTRSDDPKQTRDSAEMTVNKTKEHVTMSTAGIMWESSNKMNTKSNVAQKRTVQSRRAIEEELRRQTDAQWCIEETLGTLTRRTSRIARRLRRWRVQSEATGWIRSHPSKVEPASLSPFQSHRQDYAAKEEDSGALNEEIHGHETGKTSLQVPTTASTPTNLQSPEITPQIIQAKPEGIISQVQPSSVPQLMETVVSTEPSDFAKARIDQQQQLFHIRYLGVNRDEESGLPLDTAFEGVTDQERDMILVAQPTQPAAGTNEEGKALDLASFQEPLANLEPFPRRA